MERCWNLIRILFETVSEDMLYNADNEYATIGEYIEAENKFEGFIDACYSEVLNEMEYYLDPANGKMHTGWHVVDGKKHYFNETVPSASVRLMYIDNIG